MFKYRLLCITCPRQDMSYQKQAELACLGGADMIQLRDKTLEGKALVKLAAELQSITAAFGVPFVLNDNPEIAKEAGCSGAHIGQSDMPYEQARKLIPHGIVGVSAQNFEEAAEIAKTTADYIGFGPVFDTPSKEGPKGTGIGELKRLVAADFKMPVIAIGGIDESNVQDIMRAGADGAAVIRAVCGAPDIKTAAKRMKELITEAAIK